jgi:hypothetical protein
MPFFFLPSLPIQNRGGRGGLRPAVGAAAPRVDDGRGKEENGGGTEGSQPRAHLGSESLVEVAPQRRAAAGYGGWWWWCLEAWEAGKFGWAMRGEVGATRRPGAICRRLKVVRGGKIGGGARGWWRCLGAGGIPVAGDGVARAGRRDRSGRGVGRSWWQRSSTRGGGVGAEQPAACGGAGGADGDGAGRRSKWRPTACGLVVCASD